MSSQLCSSDAEACDDGAPGVEPQMADASVDRRMDDCMVTLIICRLRKPNMQVRGEGKGTLALGCTDCFRAGTSAKSRRERSQVTTVYACFCCSACACMAYTIRVHAGPDVWAAAALPGSCWTQLALAGLADMFYVVHFHSEVHMMLHIVIFLM